MRIELQNIYKLGEALDRDGLIVNSEEKLDAKQIAALVQGKIRPQQPVVYRYHMGKKINDLISTTWPGRFLISEKFIQVLREHNVTGWSVYPVSVILKSGRRLQGYYGFAVTGQTGPVDWYRATREEFGPSFWKTRGVFFDENSWDGSDIFFVEGTAHIGVTRKVYEALLPLKLTNVKFTQLPEVQGYIPRSRIP